MQDTTKNEKEIEKRVNPFFEPYNTPHNTAPFHRIQLGDYEEAFMEGIRRDDEATDKIVNDPAEPTFENTIARVDTDKGEHYYDLLSRVSNVFSCMMSAETCDEMEELAQKLSPILTKHANDITLNKKLFERIKFVHDHPNRELNAEEKMLLETSYDGFVRSGALLDEEGKEKLRKLTEDASMLTLQFSQNLLKENKAFTLHITDKAQLDGLPETAIAAAEHAAKEKNEEGWIFTLDYPSFSPFMTYSTQRELRKQMYMARNTVCIHDNEQNNLEICKQLVNLRRELAQLLGFETYADYVLRHRMASNTENVYKLLNDLIDAYKPTAIEEIEEVKALAKKLEGNDFEMQPWDFGFYSHKLQMEKYNLDAEMLRPYFQLDKVIDGVFGLANKLYGITFKENPNIPVYNPEVKAYEVFDEKGKYLAVYYADFHPRDGKRGGAWMNDFQPQYMDGKTDHRPHIVNVMNFTRSTADKPALFTYDEVETFLHEFGHGLHGMLTRCHYSALSGTSVPRDFVELPSKFNENFLGENEFLDTFAKHYLTGEPMPQELIDKIKASNNYHAAYACVRQLSFGYLDMAWHTLTEPFSVPADLSTEEAVIKFGNDAMEQVRVGPNVPVTQMDTAFTHIFSGGYAAGYYSYKWSELLDADAFSVFKAAAEKKGGTIFDKKAAQLFRKNILERGGTEPAMDLYKRFRGGEPTINALLERDGIKVITVQ